MKQWFDEFLGWFKAVWGDWLFLLGYLALLYLTASQNWQVTAFPVFITLFAVAGLILVLVYRYRQ